MDLVRDDAEQRNKPLKVLEGCKISHKSIMLAFIFKVKFGKELVHLNEEAHSTKYLQRSKLSVWQVTMWGREQQMPITAS